MQRRTDQNQEDSGAIGSMPSSTPNPPKQHLDPSQVALSLAAAKGRYARSRPGWAFKERSGSSPEEDYNIEKHAWRFRFSFPKPPRSYDCHELDSEPPYVPREKAPEAVRKARRERRAAAREKASRYHAKIALRKYNRTNNTKFELVEVRAICIFFEFGGGCIHHNFTAKLLPEDDDHHHSANAAGSTELFFSEVNYNFRTENDVLLCCIVSENDAGHCYGCEGEQPMVIHPSSQAYGGGSSTCIDMPLPDSASSDSD